MKIALACSAGGHLTEIRQLEEAYSRHKHFFVTFKRDDSIELRNAHYIEDPKRSLLKLAKNIAQSLVVFLRERPDVVMTTGAGVAVPFCYIAKIFGKKIIYLESYCRIERPSITGRALYRISDVFLVQWEELLEKYGGKARYWGRLL